MQVFVMLNFTFFDWRQVVCRFFLPFSSFCLTVNGLYSYLCYAVMTN